MNSLADKKNAILGGTGPKGTGLARRFAQAGLEANLISINRRYKAHAGVRVTDI